MEIEVGGCENGVGLLLCWVDVMLWMWRCVGGWGDSGFDIVVVYVCNWVLWRGFWGNFLRVGVVCEWGLWECVGGRGD